LLVAGAPRLIENGNLVYEKYRIEHEVNDDIGKSANKQRTFLGIDRSNHMYVFIADGSTNSDKGLSLQEMALFAQSKGCVDAINFDGGGSTILADRSGGLNQRLNTGANERTVHHAMLVYLDKTNKADRGETQVDTIKIDLIATPL